MLDLLRRFGLIAFSLVFWVLAFSWMMVGAALTFVLLLLQIPYQRVHVWVTAPIFVGCVPLSLTRVRVHYHPDFDPERRSVFMQNHINLLDGHLASAAIPHAFSGLMNAWQFKIPIYGWLMSMSKGIPVHRGRRDETIEAMSREARQRASIGMSVLAFPEGHRTIDGKIRPFRRGVFMMARNAEIPVVPIAVRGMYDVNAKGSWLFHPGHTVDVYVGPQMSASGLSDMELALFAEGVRTFMVHCIEHGEFPPRVPRAEADAEADTRATA